MMPTGESFARKPESFPISTLWFLGLIFLIGAVMFIQALNGPGALRAWQIFLVNFLFWTGISQAGAVFSAVLYVTNAQWGKPIRRIAEGMVAFLPLSLLFFPLVFLGLDILFPWIHGPGRGLHGTVTEEKLFWLHAPFHVVRDGIALLILSGFSLVFVYYSFSGRERISRILSPILLILYVLVYTLIAFDLVMALDPHWISTLFGWYFFVGNFYVGLAAIAILSVLMRRSFHLERSITSSLFHDLGKLIFGFSLFWVYLFWSQYLTIWYGNLPEETEYLIVRIHEFPWAYLSWSVLILVWVIPFIALLGRNAKQNPLILLLVSIIVVVGIWLERYLLVVPSLWQRGTLPLGWLELFITLGFFAACGFCYLILMRKLSLLESL